MPSVLLPPDNAGAATARWNSETKDSPTNRTMTLISSQQSTNNRDVGCHKRASLI